MTENNDLKGGPLWETPLSKRFTLKWMKQRLAEKVVEWKKEWEELSRSEDYPEIVDIIAKVREPFQSGEAAAPIMAANEQLRQQLAEAQQLAATNYESSQLYVKQAADARILRQEAERRCQELRESLQAVVDWEEEYRTINNLGKVPPSPFEAAKRALGQKP